MHSLKSGYSKILFIRRDNIGDLICTTPSIYAVREKYPDAKIGILVNTYNADAISDNPDIDEVYIYEKAKHAPDKSKFSVWLNNLKVLQKIRKEKYDVAIGCGAYSPRLARYTLLTAAKTRIGYIKRDMKKSKFYNTPLYEPEKTLHEVEKTFNLLSPLGINGKPSGLRMFPDNAEVNKVKDFLNSAGFSKRKSLIAFHISSRRPENRWPVQRFVELTNLISANYPVNILLLWSPGSEKNVYHPGDDEKAEIIKNSIKPEPAAYKTTHVRELIAALSVSSLVVCCDGGAMHIAAALEKPIVTIWGSTNPDNWAPWGTRHIILKKNRNAAGISVEDAFAAVSTLLKQ
ncbi:MAG: glycosyltransferase family 9 protein [Thermodesulfovibrionales bacterium]|nr:glycosyltransferase family 9 protein [Thermodesulfovibrionales bacterium]